MGGARLNYITSHRRPSPPPRARVARGFISHSRGDVRGDFSRHRSVASSRRRDRARRRTRARATMAPRRGWENSNARSNRARGYGARPRAFKRGRASDDEDEIQGGVAGRWRELARADARARATEAAMAMTAAEASRRDDDETGERVRGVRVVYSPGGTPRLEAVTTPAVPAVTSGAGDGAATATSAGAKQPTESARAPRGDKGDVARARGVDTVSLASGDATLEAVTTEETPVSSKGDYGRFPKDDRASPHRAPSRR